MRTNHLRNSMFKIPAKIVGTLLFVAAAAFGQNTATVTATQTNFSLVPVGVTSAPQTVTVTADSTTTLDPITQGQLSFPSGSPFAASPGTCNSSTNGNACTVTVTFTPTALG